MYINVHGHQIFAKCTLNECTKMELDPPPPPYGAHLGTKMFAIDSGDNPVKELLLTCTVFTQFEKTYLESGVFEYFGEM